MLLLKAAIYRASFIQFPEIHPLTSLNITLMMLYINPLRVSLREVSFTATYAGDALIAE